MRAQTEVQWIAFHSGHERLEITRRKDVKLEDFYENQPQHDDADT